MGTENCPGPCRPQFVGPAQSAPVASSDSSRSAKRLGQQADVFGEQREEAAGEEARDDLRVVFRSSSERASRRVAGNLARDAGGTARRIGAKRVEPDL